MLSIYTFFIIFASIGITAACFAVTIPNAIHGILYLILVFLNIACILLLLKMDFFALCLITVYIGAVAILFIFVIMMINLKIKEISIKNFFFNNFFWKISYIFLITIFFNFIFLNAFSYLNHNFFNIKYDILQTFWNFSWTSIIFNNSNIEILGNLLYSEYYIHFILASILLFIAMLASIILTMQKAKIINRQYYAIQIAKQIHTTIHTIEYIKSFHLLKKTALLNTMILTKEEKQNFITQQALAILKDPDNYKPCSFTEENCYKFKNNQMVFQEINLLKSTKLVKPKISFKNNNNFEVDPQLLKKITDNQLTPQPFIKAYYIKKTDITIDNIPEGLIAKKDFKKLFSLSILELEPIT